MSLSSIQIYRDLPIINGYVQLPPCRETEKTKVLGTDAVDAIAGAVITRLPHGSGRPTGSMFGQQEFLRLPPVTCDTWYDVDPIKTLTELG